MSKPIIGIPGARMVNTGGPVSVPVDYTNHAYCAAVEKAGGLPLLLPVPQNPEDSKPLLALCDGLLFPGGLDVDPRFYKENPLPVLGAVDAAMDAFWIYVCHYARETRMPVLGICRGLQLINVALGGSLYQDLTMKLDKPLLHTQKQNRDYLMHQVTIRPDSRLASLLNATSIYTNTMHHQCVKNPGQGLSVTAWTEDNIPEALETADGSILLVQWHPEELLVNEPRMMALFTDLMERAAQNPASSFR